MLKRYKLQKGVKEETEQNYKETINTIQIKQMPSKGKPKTNLDKQHPDEALRLAETKQTNQRECLLLKIIETTPTKESKLKLLLQKPIINLILEANKTQKGDEEQKSLR